MTTGKHPYDPSAASDLPHGPSAANDFSHGPSAVEERLREALSVAAETAVDVRPLIVPARRSRLPLRPHLHPRLRLPALLTTAAVATAVVITSVAMWAQPESPDPSLSKEQLVAVAMAGAIPAPSDVPGISVFLCKEKDPLPPCGGERATDAEKAEIQRTLDGLPGVAGVSFEDSRQAYENFKRQAEDDALMRTIRVEDMPESFRVQPEADADRQALLDAVEGLPGVSLVVDEKCQGASRC